MSDPLQGWEPGSNYGAYRDPEYTKRALAAQQKEEQKKKSATVKPGTKTTTKSGTTSATKAKAKPKKNQIGKENLVAEESDTSIIKKTENLSGDKSFL